MDCRCSVWLGSLCRLEEKKAALLGRHCCLEKGSFSGLGRELFHRRHQRRRCDLVLEACWISGEETCGTLLHCFSNSKRERIDGLGSRKSTLGRNLRRWIGATLVFDGR